MCIGHIGDDVERQHMWDIKNRCCDKPIMEYGHELNPHYLPFFPTRHSSGRFHGVWDPDNKHWGHAPPQETSSFMIDTLVNIMAGS